MTLHSFAAYRKCNFCVKNQGEDSFTCPESQPPYSWLCPKLSRSPRGSWVKIKWILTILFVLHVLHVKYTSHLQDWTWYTQAWLLCCRELRSHWGIKKLWEINKSQKELWRLWSGWWWRWWLQPIRRRSHTPDKEESFCKPVGGQPPDLVDHFSINIFIIHDLVFVIMTWFHHFFYHHNC